MDQKNSRAPARTPPSETAPEDLHVPEHEPPPMPEQADKPAHPTKQPERRAVASGATAAPSRASAAPASETEPEDLHVPEHEPPSMPELADKPSKPVG